MSDSSSQLEITQIVEEHYDMLFRYAWRLSGTREDAEDLVQQTFLTAHRKLHQLQDPQAVRSWLCTILRHSFLRSHSQPQMPLEAIPEPDAPASDSVDVFDSEALQEALNDLPEEFRSPLIAFYLGELTYREIAEQMEVPLGTVMSRLARGREYLKQKLMTKGFTEAPT